MHNEIALEQMTSARIPSVGYPRKAHKPSAQQVVTLTSNLGTMFTLVWVHPSELNVSGIPSEEQVGVPTVSVGQLTRITPEERVRYALGEMTAGILSPCCFGR